MKLNEFEWGNEFLFTSVLKKRVVFDTNVLCNDKISGFGYEKHSIILKSLLSSSLSLSILIPLLDKAVFIEVCFEDNETQD